MERCRICLKRKKNLCSVFEEDNGISYADMLTSVAKVKIMKDVNKNRLCLQCRRKLRSLYYFKNRIERSDIELNQHSKRLWFNNIAEVKAQLMKEIKDDVKIITNIDVNYNNLWQSGCKSICLRDTTITKIVGHQKCNNQMTIVTHDLDLGVSNDQPNNYCINHYDDLVMWDYNLLHENYDKQRHKKKKNEVANTKKNLKLSSNLKKVCIKPIVLDNIRIIPSRRKPNKMNKDYKRRKRLDICPYCGIMSSNMKTHIMVHIGERKYKCSECNKAFFSSNLLNYHQTKHLTSRTYKCDHCVAVFNNKSSLLSHMVTHSDDKKHVCPICNKGFKRKSSLLRHKLIHNSSAKSVKCDLCNMSFLYKQGLRHHMRVHTGERPFKCEICSQPYSYKHDFNRHCLKKHGVFLKQRSVHVMNERVLVQERALMKDLMLRVQGVVKEGEPLNPFQGPYAALAFDEAVKALGSCQIPIDIML